MSAHFNVLDLKLYLLTDGITVADTWRPDQI